MNDIKKRELAIETYNLGLKMGELFAKDKYSGEYMVLAIMGCIAGLTNTTYSLMPVCDFSGEYFKSLRKAKGYTLRQVEDATGLSNAYLSQFENGKIKKPSHDTITKLLNFLNDGITVNGGNEIGNLKP